MEWVKFSTATEVGGALISLYHGKDLRLNLKAWAELGEPEAISIYHEADKGLLGFAPATADEPGSFPFWISPAGRTVRIPEALEAFGLSYAETSRTYRPKWLADRKAGDPGMYIELDQPVRVGGAAQVVTTAR
jgi:hypothetical protein